MKRMKLRLLTLEMVLPWTSVLMTAPERVALIVTARLSALSRRMLVVMVACTVPGCTSWVTVMFSLPLTPVTPML